MKGRVQFWHVILQFLCADVPLQQLRRFTIADDGQILFQRMKSRRLPAVMAVRRASEFCNERQH